MEDMDWQWIQAIGAAASAITAILVWFWKRQLAMDDRLLNTYSKAETDKQIALHTQPMQDAVIENTMAVRELTGTLTDVRLGMVEVRTDVKHIKAEQGGKKEG